MEISLITSELNHFYLSAPVKHKCRIDLSMDSHLVLNPRFNLTQELTNMSPSKVNITGITGIFRVHLELRAYVLRLHQLEEPVPLLFSIPRKRLVHKQSGRCTGSRGKFSFFRVLFRRFKVPQLYFFLKKHVGQGVFL